jgi:hypothetical protein
LHILHRQALQSVHGVQSEIYQVHFAHQLQADTFTFQLCISLTYTTDTFQPFAPFHQFHHFQASEELWYHRQSHHFHQSHHFA